MSPDTGSRPEVRGPASDARFLRIVYGAAEALFPCGFLHFFQRLLLLLELRLHGVDFLLFLLLPLIPLSAVRNAVRPREMDGVAQTFDVLLQGSDRVLLVHDLGLPVLGFRLMVSGVRLRIRWGRSRMRRNRSYSSALGSVVIRDEMSRLRRRRWRGFRGLHIMSSGFLRFELSFSLLLLQFHLARDLTEGERRSRGRCILGTGRLILGRLILGIGHRAQKKARC